MKLFCQLFAFVLSVLLSLSPEPTFAADSPLDYSDISKPEFFPILPWDRQHGSIKRPVKQRDNGLESIAECHFNMAGFVLASDLPLCKKLGLGAILIPAEDYLIAWDRRHGWSKLSDTQIEQRVKSLIKAGGRSPAVKGYFIQDEPGVQDFPALAKAVAAVNKYAPGKFAYINLFPDYATIGAPNLSQLGTANYTEYLERFVTEVKPPFLSYDNYMVQMSQDLTLPDKAASYFRNLLDVRRVAQKHRLPYLNIVSANQIRPHTTIPSPANLLLQAYTTLAAGYRGVTWYTYYEGGYGYGAIDSTDKKTLTWPYLAEVNRQVATLAPIMSRLESTGVFFTAPAPVKNLPLLPGKLVAAADCATPLMIGEFKHSDGSLYLMVVNLSIEKSAKFNLVMQNQSENLSIVSPMDRSLSAFDKKAGLWLVAGQGMLLQLGQQAAAKK